MIAASCGNLESLFLLLSAGADVNYATKVGGHTALMVAIDAGQWRCVKLMLGYDKNEKTGDITPHLEMPAAMADMRQFPVARPNQARTDSGFTPLMCAAEIEAVSIIDMLLDAGADVNQGMHRDNHTPVMLAARLGLPKSLKRLLERGAHVDEVMQYGDDGYTALMYAAKDGHLECVKLLLAHGAEPGYDKTPDGWSPVLYAADGRHSAVIGELLGRGADPNAAAMSNRVTPLLIASREGDLASVSLLLRHNAEVRRLRRSVLADFARSLSLALALALALALSCSRSRALCLVSLALLSPPFPASAWLAGVLTEMPGAIFPRHRAARR